MLEKPGSQNVVDDTYITFTMAIQNGQIGVNVLRNVLLLDKGQ